MSATLTIPGVTPAQYAALQAAARKQGIGLAGTSGEASSHGCTVSYEWAGWPGCASAALTLTVVHAPPFCAGFALHKLQDLIESVITAPAVPAEKGSS